jgi:mannose-6-phosphate isomerase-like protein (cupin superfamily)
MSAGTSTTPKAEVPVNTGTEEEEMNHFVLAKDELPHDGSAHHFEGHLYDGAEVSFFISETPPGGKGSSLHAHPYAEVFVVEEGELTFTVGGDTAEATGGQIVVAPAGTSRKFTNPGSGRARHLDIHTRGRMYTQWLEEG